jgi:hypothetical protein
MSSSPAARRSRRRSPRSRLLVRLALLALGVALFGAGVAVGEALHDNPKPGITQTTVRTLHP